MQAQLTLLQLLLLRPSSEKIRFVTAMALRHVYCSRILPVVFLGLLSGFLTQCRKVHWRTGQLWFEGRPSSPVCWKSSHS